MSVLTKQQWYDRYSTDFLRYVIDHSQCVCCGEAAEQLDHIIPKPNIRISLLRTAIRLSPGSRIHDYKEGNLQPLCKRCNLSKGNSSTCNFHAKYLGIWNYLPKLEEL